MLPRTDFAFDIRGPLSAAAIRWSYDAQERLTLVVKASYQLHEDGSLEARPARPIAEQDEHRGQQPSGVLEMASELVPLVVGTGITVIAHAFAPERAIIARPRLLVARGDRVLIDKQLLVRGDPAGTAPVWDVPITYDLARRSELVPIGRPSGGLVELVSGVHGMPGFGPVPAAWPSRASHLGTTSLGEVQRGHLPRGFDWGFFQAAPQDQVVQSFDGTETLVLEQMQPTAHPLTIPLNPPAPTLLWWSQATPFIPLALRTDGVHVDLVRRRVDFVYRGTLPLHAGIKKPRAIVDIPGSTADLDGTITVDPGAAQGKALPFEETAPPSRRRSAPPPGSAFDELRREPAPPPAAIDMDGTLELGQNRLPPHVAELLRQHKGTTASSGEPTPSLGGGAEDGAAAEKETIGQRLMGQGAIGQGQGPRASAPAGSGPAPRGSGRADADLDDLMGSQGPASNIPKGDAPADRRVGDTVPFSNSTSFTCASVAWSFKPPQDVLVVVVKGTFDLVQGGSVSPREESDYVTGDLYLEDDFERSSLAYPSDFSYLKPAADVVLHGSAYAPGKSAAAMQVSLRFGKRPHRIDRSLVVFGDRNWESKLMSLVPGEPAEFTRMPLTWERAFGGQGYADNPVGVGYKAREKEGVRALPNVEQVASRVVSPGDSPRPASFSAIPPLWKARWSKMGHYDKKWGRERWPYFAEDFDYAFFLHAPKEQQLPSLVGDEPFELVGVHPVHPSLKGRLPGVKPRCFAVIRPSEGEKERRFLEVRLKLDTVVFEPDEDKVNLVWRGFFDVSDDDASEVDDLFVMAEPVEGASATAVEAFAAYKEHLAQEQRELEGVLPEEEEQAPVEPKAEPEADEPEPEEPLDPALADLQKLLDAQEAELAASGPPPEPPPPDPEAVARALREAGADEEAIADAMKAFAPEPEEDEPGPVETTLRQRVMQALEAKEDLSGIDLSGADLSDLDFSGVSLVRSDLRNCNLRGAVFRGSDLSGTLLSAAAAAGVDFAGAVLSETDLLGADLTGASFEEAELTHADFSETKLEKASFKKARGDSPHFVRIEAKSADFTEAELPDADFTGAVLDGANFSSAKMAEIRLYDASAVEARFVETEMRGARAEAADFRRAVCVRMRAPSAVFERARVSNATFGEADLSDSSFVKATALEAQFARADLRMCRFRRAKLGKAVFQQANLHEANFEGANLDFADLAGANLHQVGFWKASMIETKLGGAIITQSSLKEQ